MVSLAALILVFVLVSPVPGLAAYSNTGVPPEGPQSTISILSLNVMQSSGLFEPRTPRFEGIADYLNSNQPVHALAFQELSAGTELSDPPQTDDSGADLAGMLGGKYGYYTVSSHRYEDHTYEELIGLVWTEFKVGVLPRYNMEYVEATKLDPPGDNYSDGLDPSYRSNVVMCVLDIPGFGPVQLYSTHFYGTGLQTQADNLIEFINQIEQEYVAQDLSPRATIVAGDLNFTEDNPAYGIFNENGFVDSYKEVKPDDPGYTYGVPGDYDWYDSGTTPKRIDYIFVRGENIRISSSEVVFDGTNGPYVSDHFGVLTEITATPVPSSLLLLGSSLLGLAGLGYRRRRK